MPEKRDIRIEVWSKMERYEIATNPRPCYGKIPNFVGSYAAAKRIIFSTPFRRAEVIYSTPDLPQKPIREAALKMGKILIMATPHLRRGFVLVDPQRLPPSRLREVSSLRGAMTHCEKVDIIEDVHIDMFVVGSIAAGVDGSRIGRGDGRYDLEYGVLRELRVADDDTLVVTTIHDIQLVDGIPMRVHDVPADIIATPSKTIVVEEKRRKPVGIYWELLTMDVIESIPILRRLFGYA